MRCWRSPLTHSCQGLARCRQPASAATWRQRSAARLSAAMWAGRPRNRPIEMPRISARAAVRQGPSAGASWTAP
eukprot:1211489-Alexandrium_andersonii.AAC.1